VVLTPLHAPERQLGIVTAAVVAPFLTLAATAFCTRKRST
jgi:hypothetical protein